MITRGIKIVENIDYSNLSDEYDLFVCALGYESRSVGVAKVVSQFCKNKVAIGFRNNQVHEFKKNKKALHGLGFETFEVVDRNFSETLLEILTKEEDNLKILVDISSFNRFRIATLIDILRRKSEQNTINCDFLYNIAEFDKPAESYSNNLYVGSIIPAFSGWSIDPTLPSLAIVGLGYEESRALGAIEYIQSSKVLVYKPDSPDDRYEAEVNDANNTLLKITDEGSQVEYDLCNPYNTFFEIQNLISHISFDSNINILPFGPKIFTLISLLLACNFPHITIWRVSEGKGITPVNRKSSKYTFGVRTVFSKEIKSSFQIEKLITNGFFSDY